MGVTEISVSIVIAIATSAGAFFGHQKIKAERMNPVLIDDTWNLNDYVFFRIKIFPAKHQSTIKKISSNAEGIFFWKEYSIADAVFSTVGGKDHYESVDLNFSLLPDSLGTEPLDLVFSIKSRKAQSSFTIKLCTSSSIFPARYKLTIAANMQND